jgi:hypothetical protein
MRVIKLGIISVIVLFIILTAMGALLPSHVLVSRAVDIYGNKQTVKQSVLDLRQWNNWMPIDSTVTFAYNEKQNALVSGNTKITVDQNADSLLVTNWKTGANTMKGTFRIINQPNNITTVQWQMEEKIGWFPWEKFASMTADKMLGSSMEKGLANLKLQMEQQ